MRTPPIHTSVFVSLLLAGSVGCVYAYLLQRSETPSPDQLFERIGSIGAPTSGHDLPVVTRATKLTEKAAIVILGGRASRAYSISLPPEWSWQRSTVSKSSTYGNYGTPAFDERFASSGELGDRIVFGIQSNHRTEVTPSLPWGSGYCSMSQRIEYGGRQLSTTVHSLMFSSRSAGAVTPACDSVRSASVGNSHFAELRFCVGAAGEVSKSIVVRGPGELYNDCQRYQNPADADYLRISISCVGPKWSGLEGRARCMAILQSVTSSLIQQTT